MEEIVSVHVDQECCVFHHFCVQACPEVFEVDESSKYRQAKVKEDAKRHFRTDVEGILDAFTGCPMDAIIVNGKAPNQWGRESGTPRDP